MGNGANYSQIQHSRLAVLVKENLGSFVESKAALSRMSLPGLNTSLDSFRTAFRENSQCVKRSGSLVDQTKRIADKCNTT